MSSEFKAGRNAADYDFWRCQKCQTLVTKPQMDAGMARGRGPCPCGSLHYHPSNPPDALCEDAGLLRWLGWMLVALVTPSKWPVLTFTLKRQFGWA